MSKTLRDTLNELHDLFAEVPAAFKPVILRDLASTISFEKKPAKIATEQFPHLLPTRSAPTVAKAPGIKTKLSLVEENFRWPRGCGSSNWVKCGFSKDNTTLVVNYLKWCKESGLSQNFSTKQIEKFKLDTSKTQS
jgi:hypothetical protein